MTIKEIVADRPVPCRYRRFGALVLANVEAEMTKIPAKVVSNKWPEDGVLRVIFAHPHGKHMRITAISGQGTWYNGDIGEFREVGSGNYLSS